MSEPIFLLKSTIQRTIQNTFTQITPLNLITLFFVTIFTKLVYKLFYEIYLSPLKHIPGPKACAFTDVPLRMRRPYGHVYSWYQELHSQYGNVVRVAPGFVMFSNKEAIRQIMIEDQFPKNTAIKNIQTNPNVPTLFTMTDPTFHKQRRRLLSHAFSVKYLSNIEPLIHSCVESLVNKLASLSNDNDLKSPVVNIYGILQSMALDVIGETAFGGSFNIVEQGNHPLPKKVSDEFKRRVICATFPFLRHFKKQDPWTQNFTNNIIRERREMNARGEKRMDLLQMLLDARDEETGEGLSDFDIYDQSVEFVMAGSDTTAFTTFMALMLLLHHPEKFRVLMTEFNSLSSDKIPRHESLKHLTYLNAVINETMRLWPVATGGFSREAPKDMAINGTFVPKGTQIIASVYSIHHSKEIWGADVEEFVPERWLNEKNKSNLNRHFYPFGGGSRLCIAMNFSLMEIRIALAALMINFEFDMVKGQDLEIVHYLTPSLKTKRFDVHVRQRNTH
ncbi:3283_t:CDS:2 [Ambispora gerdemannii]|uniref:3283_t:CDS:1 n=1 Tax=Ambispora gerdemannii TaxID=144530 RepID=A0A9N8ZUH8_9GLOM|nr:3283_t:CDS:2 [Ambispora gerdemannii]